MGNEILADGHDALIDGDPFSLEVGRRLLKFIAELLDLGECCGPFRSKLAAHLDIPCPKFEELILD